MEAFESETGRVDVVMEQISARHTRREWVSSKSGRFPGSRISAALRLPGYSPSGLMKGRYRIQSRGRLRIRAPQLGPPFLIPD